MAIKKGLKIRLSFNEDISNLLTWTSQLAHMHTKICLLYNEKKPGRINNELIPTIYPFSLSNKLENFFDKSNTTVFIPDNFHAVVNHSGR